MGNDTRRTAKLIKPRAVAVTAGDNDARLRAWRPAQNPVVTCVSHQDAAVRCEGNGRRDVELVEPGAFTPSSSDHCARLRAWRPTHDAVVVCVNHQDAAVFAVGTFEISGPHRHALRTA